MPFRILLLLIFFIVQQSRAQPLPALIPYTDGKSWGYADTNTRVIIRPQWLQADFFNGHKARIAIGNNHFALIDTSGTYIIPPSRHWNGTWDGAGKTPLNSTDSNGLYGLIDTNNQVLIPFEWDGPGEQLPEGYDVSFKMVKRSGRYGLIGNDNKLLIPCRYPSLSGRPDLLPIRALLTEDPDNMAGTNRSGLISADGHILLPPRFASVALEFYGNDTLLHCRASVDNEGSGHYVDKWFRYAAGKSAVPINAGNYPFNPPYTHGDEIPVLKNGLLLFYSKGEPGLMDSNKKIIVPAGTPYQIHGDTLIVTTEQRSGPDSLYIRIDYLGLPAITTLKPAKTIWLYDPLTGKEKNYNYSDRYDAEPLPRLYWDVVYIKSFYKDSILFHITKKITEAVYIIAGRTVSGSGQTYYAVIDNDLNYIIEPGSNVIYHYNREDDIATISGYDVVSGRAGYGLRTAGGKELMPLQCNSLYEGVLWKGVLLGLAAWEPPAEKQNGEMNYSYRQYPAPRPLYFKIVDPTGALLPRTKNYFFSYSAWLSYKPGLPRYSLYTSDGYIFPDGSPVFPALQPAGHTISYAVNNWFFVLRGNNRILVDTGNREIIPGFTCENIQPVSVKGAVLNPNRSGRFTEQEEVTRLYFVSLKNNKGLSIRCYLDDKGRLYYNKTRAQNAPHTKNK